jgi:hypothetical protein
VSGTEGSPLQFQVPHALVGRYADALREITSFLQIGPEQRPPKR